MPVFVVAAALSAACFVDTPDGAAESMTGSTQSAGSSDDGSGEDGASESATDGDGPFGFGPACDQSDPTVSRDPDSGQCYRVSAEFVTWEVAQASCEADGGYLAIVDSAREQVFVSEILWAGTPEAAVYNAWIGLLRTSPDEAFAWIDGMPVESPQWEPGQPNEPVEMACAYAREDSAWRWHDAPCGEPTPYVCEWTPEPPVDG